MFDAQLTYGSTVFYAGGVIQIEFKFCKLYRFEM